MEICGATLTECVCSSIFCKVHVHTGELPIAVSHVHFQTLLRAGEMKFLNHLHLQITTTQWKQLCDNKSVCFLTWTGKTVSLTAKVHKKFSNSYLILPRVGDCGGGIWEMVGWKWPLIFCITWEKLTTIAGNIRLMDSLKLKKFICTFAVSVWGLWTGTLWNCLTVMNRFRYFKIWKRGGFHWPSWLLWRFWCSWLTFCWFERRGILCCVWNAFCPRGCVFG